MGRKRTAHHAGGDDVGPRHHRFRGGGHAHRRLRFPREAHQPAEAARDRRQGARGRARAAQDRPRAREPRARARDPGAAPAPGAGGAPAHAGAADRRAGLRLRAVRAPPAHSQYAVGRARGNRVARLQPVRAAQRGARGHAIPARDRDARPRRSRRASRSCSASSRNSTCA